MQNTPIPILLLLAGLLFLLPALVSKLGARLNLSVRSRIIAGIIGIFLALVGVGMYFVLPNSTTVTLLPHTRTTTPTITTVALKPSNTPTRTPTTTPTPTLTPARTPNTGRLCTPRETLIAPFAGGIVAVQSANAYTGTVTLNVSGMGQSGADNSSDAFYVFDSDDNASPSDGFTLAINTRPVRTWIPGGVVPPYNPDHAYKFSIEAEGGVLTYGVLDSGVADNSGSYTVVICEN